MSPHFEAALQAFAPSLPLAVAYSGGADSTALLVACARKWPGCVQAIHVHHGLQAAADDFVRHCTAVCHALQVPLQIRWVQAHAAPGESPEDAARRARYQALEAAALAAPAQTAIKSIALAQHADDQVETVVLALSRGAGLPGLSAMPAHWMRAGLHFYRPLLGVPGAEIRLWLARSGVPCVEDPSNQDMRYTRNRIRWRVLPALQDALPQFRKTIARSAAHAAQAQVLLAELAQLDLLTVGVPPQLVHLRALSAPRQANVLRYWLRSQFDTVPSTAQMAELLRQIAACTTRGHQIHIRVGGGHCERKGPLLHWYNR